ncbi:leucine--tRNA ligase [Candidatus Microgenomates bacterium]|nr:MAG: leucine--tRNA ligase [Candidatus Microgenomates bacterium]
MRTSINFKEIERKWQKVWEENSLYFPNLRAKTDSKFYNLWMFPYPSAEGLHAGHAFASTGSDVYARFMRMHGRTVFQPIGYDSFGIHSENYAIKIDENPQKVVERTTAHYAKQMRALGHGYDWTRTVTTSEPEYYKWTQWIFLKMWEKGLAYKKKASVNYCPSCKTVLADEQVMTPKQAGKEPKNAEGYAVPNSDDLRICERCGTVVEKRELDQWFFRITDYADRLLEGLENIDWSERVKVAQREWIGRKEGVTIEYKIKNNKGSINCFTTRPDTNFGATFVVVSPEYAKDNLFAALDDKYKDNVSKYINICLNKTERQRREEGKEKTGEFTGLYVINNLNSEELPVWVSDFVLSGFGTGAVVGVPGHDKRDFEFAKAFNLSIKRVVVSSNGDKSEIKSAEQVQENEGKIINSDFLNGLDIFEAKEKIIDFMVGQGWGVRTTTYHLRDWLVSRQRYWGAPIPMYECPKCGWVPVDEQDLPVLLPDITDYKPKGEGKGPLASHEEFYKVTCIKCGGEARRETDVMDTFVDSSWYFLRYPSVDAENSDKAPFDTEITKRWLPVDLYFGGAEHSVLHLMYARFVAMVLHDMGYLDFNEPFVKFYAHGLMIKDGSKMSKSRGNVVNPDEYVEKYGADTLRLYLMFMGPMDGNPDFRDTGIEGMSRFINKVWGIFTCVPPTLDANSLKKLSVLTHRTIKKVSLDLSNFKYNTSIAAIMEFVNELKLLSAENKGAKHKHAPREWTHAVRALCQLLAPFTPHVAEEVWVEVLGNKFSVHASKWPIHDEALVQEETFTIPVQVNGKLRGLIEVDVEQSGDEAYCLELARNNAKVLPWIENKKILKEIYINKKLINFVV